MSLCFFASDLHGHVDRYETLFRAIESEEPDAVLLGGDLLPSGLVQLQAGTARETDFVHGVLGAGFDRLRASMGDRYPRVFVILGNDDRRMEEEALLALEARGLWVYAHDRRIPFDRYHIYGYSYVPPTPFLLKDWERYDVSRYVDPGCVSPEEGWRSVAVEPHEIRYATIRADLEQLTGDEALEHGVLLLHTPPYQTNLDRADLDGQMIDHVPLDVHVGSIAVRRFIEARQPLLTLHGHVHESAKLTGSWRDRIGRTHMFTGGHGGPELALVRFDLDDLDAATRALL